MTTTSWFKRHFVPHQDNDHRPHFLRDKAFVSSFAVVSILEIIYLLTLVFGIFTGWRNLAAMVDSALIYVLLILAVVFFLALLLAIFTKIKVQYLEIVMNGLVLIAYVLLLVIMNQVIRAGITPMPASDWFLVRR